MDGADASPEKVVAQRHHAAQLPARSNVFVERLWRSVKYEDVYLKGYDGVNAARFHLAAYFDFYNARRPHQSHDGRTPDMVYFATLPTMKEAA